MSETVMNEPATSETTSPTATATAAATTDADRGDLLPPVTATVEVPLAPADAFRLFTADVATWWPLATHSVGGERAAGCRIESGVGGRIVERWDDGSERDWGRVTAWEPPARLAFTWHPGRDPDTAQDVEVRFLAAGAGCRVELAHHGWERLVDDAAKTREAYLSGWAHVLGDLFRRAAERRAVR